MDAKQLIEFEADTYNSMLYSVEPSEFQYSLGVALRSYDDSKDKLIFLYRLHPLRVKALNDHVETCPHPRPCYNEVELSKEVYFIEQEIKRLNPNFDFQILMPNVDTNLLKANLVKLSKFPDAGKLLQDALNKLNEGKYERNLLDDLRLCLETLLKLKLGNDKSLDNQVEFIGKHLKDSGVSGEARNMFVKLIEYYSKYQNEYVKHNDAVKRGEIELMINLTSSMIYFIVES